MAPRLSRPRAAAFAGVLMAALLAPLAASASTAPPPPERRFTLPAGLTEISGLAMSARHPGVVYAHNDSGNSSEIFAIDAATGQLRARLTVTNAPNTDWEAIAVGKDGAGRPAIYVGDIGNNFGSRDPNLYRLPEPDTLANASVTATAFRLRFADGPHDAESLLVDPVSDQVYVASKNYAGAGKLYKAPLPLDPAQVNTLSDTGRPAPTFATDGAFSPDGKAYAIRSGGPIGENAAWIHDAAGTQLAKVALPAQPQAEAVTYFDRTSLLVASENDAQVWRVHLPPEAVPGTGDGPEVTSPGDQTGTVGTPVSVRIQATDPGGGALRFTAAGLPDGLSIGQDGVVTGTPARDGTFAVTVTATNQAGRPGSASFTWRIAPAGGGESPVVAAPGDQTSVFNKPVDLRLTATGGTGTRTFRAEGLPFGLTISAAGRITGRAWAVGTFTVKATATDTAGRSGSATFAWTVGWF